MTKYVIVARPGLATESVETSGVLAEAKRIALAKAEALDAGERVEIFRAKDWYREGVEYPDLVPVWERSRDWGDI